MGSLFLYQALRPGASLFNHLSVDFGVPYFSLTAGLNVLISSLIVVQWLMFRREVKRVLGHDYAVFSPYVAAGPLLIESSLIYAVNSIIFVIPYGLGSHVANIFLPLQALAPVCRLSGPLGSSLLTRACEGFIIHAHCTPCRHAACLGLSHPHHFFDHHRSTF